MRRRTAKGVITDNLFDLAAQQAYYFFFALFPAILTLISIASFFPVANLVDESVAMLGRVAPGDVLKIISDQMTKISQSNHGGALTFAFLLTLWSTSGAMVSIITTLNAAYGITEGRPLWKVRLTALALTIGMSMFVLVSMALVLAGPTFAEHLANTMHLGAAFKWTWWVLQWPVVFALVATAIGIVYYFAPDAEQDWAWITPGSIVATLLWIVVSLAFKLYISYFGNYNETYGTLGAFIVLLTWFYLSGLAILVGAEMNAEIEHASPHGKNPGEKVPGEKKKIGPRGAAGLRGAEGKGRARRAAVPRRRELRPGSRDAEEGAGGPPERAADWRGRAPARGDQDRQGHQEESARRSGRERCVKLTSAARRRAAACRQSPSTPAPPVCRGLVEPSP